MTMDPKMKGLFLSAAEMESAPTANGERARMRPKPGTFNVLRGSGSNSQTIWKPSASELELQVELHSP